MGLRRYSIKVLHVIGNDEKTERYRLVAKMKITFATNGEDWEALYIDGRKILEGHSLRIDEVLEAVGMPCSIKVIPANKNFPNKLAK